MGASGEFSFKGSTHTLCLVHTKHLAREKTIQSINQMFSLPSAKHLGNWWDHFLFIRGPGHSNPDVQSQHENTEWGWRIPWPTRIPRVGHFSGHCGSIQHHLLDVCYFETFWCQYIFKPLLHKEQRLWVEKRTPYWHSRIGSHWLKAILVSSQIVDKWPSSAVSAAVGEKVPTFCWHWSGNSQRVENLAIL